MLSSVLKCHRNSCLCNYLLSGCPQYLSNKLQKVQNNTGTKKASSLANIWKMQWSSKCQPIYTPGLSCQKPCVGKQIAPLQQSFQDSRNVSAVICKINEKYLVNCWSFPQQHHPQNNFKISYTTKQNEPPAKNTHTQNLLGKNNNCTTYPKQLLQACY